jgi:predicted flap endonuclease-1-like 5' DNA nuclease
MSVAKKLLREKEAEGTVVAYIRESGFAVYSTPSEMEKTDIGGAALVASALEDIAAFAPKETVIDEDMEAALAAASSAGTMVKPSRLAYKRREAGEKKERKDALPEVVIEPLPQKEPEKPAPEVKEEKPKKKTTKKPAKKAEKKPAAKKPAAKKTSKKAEKKPAAKKPAAKKPAAKKTTKKAEKKPAAKKPAKKPAKKDEKKPAAKKPTAKKPQVADIAGVGPKTVEALREGGFKTVAAISKADPAKMAKKVDGVSEAKAKQFIDAAKALLK